MRVAISVSTKEKDRADQSPYFHALIEAGAKAEELLLATNADSADLRDFNGLLLTGGADIDPTYYHEPKKHNNVRIDKERDKFEFSLLERAIELRLPVLAICRGAQLMNVYFGGTLYQDIERDWVPENENVPLVSHKQAAGRAEPTHSVLVTDPQSRLARVLQGRCNVNSLHHQGIKRPGHGLRVTAHAEDGLVEAFESAEGEPYRVAVQWHPEELIESREQRKLFEQFLGECRRIASRD